MGLLPALHRVLKPLAARRCPCCGAVLERVGLCPTCARLLAPRVAGYCPGCGEFLPDETQPPTRCGRCRIEPRPWDALGFHAGYEGLLRECLLGFKFGSALAGQALLGGFMLEAFQRHAAREGGLDPRGPELICAVPMHWRRLALRGHNQSHELARAVSRGLGAALEPQAVRKVRPTGPQSRLDALRRRTNLKDAFSADPALVAGRRVLAVDDVLTTGSTLEAVVRALRAAGAARVEVLVLARDCRKGG